MPLGEYRITVDAPGFSAQEQTLLLSSQHEAEVHFSLQVARTQEKIVVIESAENVNPESSTTTSVISRAEIARSPGADHGTVNSTGWSLEAGHVKPTGGSC